MSRNAGGISDEKNAFSGQREVIGVVISHFGWQVDQIQSQMARHKQLAQSIEISADKRQLYVKEDEYIFRNFFGDVEFNDGIHYWEIVADARTEHELKVGVSAINNIEDVAEYQTQVKELKKLPDGDSSANSSLSKSPTKLKSASPCLNDQIQLSFSDVATGWAFFGIGQIRHNSNMLGRKYGKSFKR